MTYDIKKIKEKIASLQGKGKRDFSSEQKIEYYKPALGSQDVRFLPYRFSKGQPFQQIDYYDNKELLQGRRRIVSPSQFDLPDPVADLAEELRADRSNDASWNILRKLRVKESYYAPVLVRGQESKGVQVWEMGQGILNQVYSILAHPDYVDDDMFDATKGFDFTITCTSSGKTINLNGKTYPVKNYDIQPRRKSSKVLDNEDEMKALLDSVPDLGEYFKKFVTREDKMKEIVVDFLSSGITDEEAEKETELEVMKVDNSTKEAESKLDAAFADLD